MKLSVMNRWTALLIIALCVGGCAPKEPIVLRTVHIVQILPNADGNPTLKAEAIFFNPNKGSVRLKQINMEILLDGKKAALIEQKMNLLVKGNADFTIPLEVQLRLNEIGFLDTLLSFFGGKKYEVQFLGNLKISVGGFPVKIPVDYKGQIKF